MSSMAQYLKRKFSASGLERVLSCENHAGQRQKSQHSGTPTEINNPMENYPRGVRGSGFFCLLQFRSSFLCTLVIRGLTGGLDDLQSIDKGVI